MFSLSPGLAQRTSNNNDNNNNNAVAFNISHCNAVKLAISHYNAVIIITNDNKTSSTGQSGQNKIVYKLLKQPNEHLRHGKTEKQTE